MIQYLTILLDDTSTSFCHYENKLNRRPIDLGILKDAIKFGMKNNLMIQFVYPNYELPKDYDEVIESIDHSKIVPNSVEVDNSDIIVYNDISVITITELNINQTYVFRTEKKTLFANQAFIKNCLSNISRMNLVITDLDAFDENDYEAYKKLLDDWCEELSRLYLIGKMPQVNVLTDRIMLDGMNNCGAGDNSITLAPDGNYYVCPAFYYEEEDEDFGLGKAKMNIGSLKNGLNIRNHQLYRLDYAPICRICDAYHCKRCIWLNRKLTYDVNTPGRQQCVIAHIERSASKQLLDGIHKHSELFKGRFINEIDYIDPFEIITK